MEKQSFQRTYAPPNGQNSSILEESCLNLCDKLKDHGESAGHMTQPSHKSIKAWLRFNPQKVINRSSLFAEQTWPSTKHKRPLFSLHLVLKMWIKTKKKLFNDFNVNFTLYPIVNNQSQWSTILNFALLEFMQCIPIFFNLKRFQVWKLGITKCALFPKK